MSGRRRKGIERDIAAIAAEVGAGRLTVAEGVERFMGRAQGSAPAVAKLRALATKCLKHAGCVGGGPTCDVTTYRLDS